ncbi:putative plastid division protein PDV1/PDV2 [Dioscorea sansibarensis]
MEGEAMSMVIGRASELRFKIIHCIDSCSKDPLGAGESSGGGRMDDDYEDEEQAESLAGIRDALGSLEHQLSAFQTLQQQQSYEREATLSQINRSRMILLKKLKEYKGEDLEVIQEALTFAGESIEYDEDLILPPYPSHLPDLFVLDDLYQSSHSNSKNILSENALTGKLKKLDESDDSGERKHGFGFRHFAGLVARSAVTLVGIISVLTLAGVKPTLGKRCTQFKVQELFEQPSIAEEAESEVSFQCPPGKLLVIEDGKPRCLVKERFEIPFVSNVSAPNVSYGFG